MFEYHKLNDNGFAEMHLFKQTMTDAVSQCLNAMPDSREKSSFKTNMEVAVFWGARAIASKPENFDSIIEYTPQGAREVPNASK